VLEKMLGVKLSFRGANAVREPGIQMQPPRLFLDPGFATIARKRAYGVAPE
jgi:hypothetical protein